MSQMVSPVHFHHVLAILKNEIFYYSICSFNANGDSVVVYIIPTKPVPPIDLVMSNFMLDITFTFVQTFCYCTVEFTVLFSVECTYKALNVLCLMFSMWCVQLVCR